MPKRRVRPDPVSCESCRTKKLKCSRVEPCSNCAARGIACRFLVPPKSAVSATSLDPPLSSRLERLESIVGSLQRQFYMINKPASSLPTTASYSGSQTHGDQVNSRVQEYANDLENLGTRDDTLLYNMSGIITYEVRDVSDVLRHNCGLRNIHYSDPVITLPPYDIASLLLKNYETKLLSLCPIVHLPTIRSNLKTIYLRLNNQSMIVPNSVSVVLSLLALGAFFSEPSSVLEIEASEAGCITLSKILSKNALDVLDYSRRTSSGTLEDVQAYILMSLALSHIDGFSNRSRMLFSSALSMARDLRLHRLDEYEYFAKRPADARSHIEIEMKRRIFWYIASEDWLQSTISGPQQGTYLMQDRFIEVKLPQDCAEDELTFYTPDGEASEDTLTYATVFLERIRLAQICREITDTVPLNTNALLQMPYERIIALDQKLKNFLATMSPFLLEDYPNREILETIYPQLPSWRYCIAKAAHSRRWKLNQPFLLRQSLNPCYSYSRNACLESAQAVIRGYASLVGHDETSSLLTRTGIAVHFTHLALSILIMDLCFNRPEADVGQIKRDIAMAFKIFADAPTVSPLLAKSMASLKAMLKRNNIELSEASSCDEIDRLNDDQGTSRSISELTGGETPFGRHSEEGASLDTSFDTFWNMALQDNGNMDLNDWDGLFSTLDNRPI